VLENTGLLDRDIETEGPALWHFDPKVAATDCCKPVLQACRSV